MDRLRESCAAKSKKGPRSVVALLLVILVGELAAAIHTDGLTVDELVYMGSGYRHVAASDFRLNPEQPPLAKLLGALPLLALRLRVPEDRSGDSEWSWSYRFVHMENDAGRVVTWARAPNALLTVALALLLWAWAGATHGDAAGFAALALAVFHPSLLAHGHLMTTDLPGSLTMVAASFAFWWWSRAPSVRRAVLVGLAVGVAAATRLTGWLLLPVFVTLAAISAAEGGHERDAGGERRGRGSGGRPAQLGTLAGALAVLVPGVIWASYGFRYAPWPGESVATPPGPWMGRAGALIVALESARVLPEAYLEGTRFVVEHNIIGHPTYLLGRMSSAGWPHYYLVAFLVKNTPGFLLAVLAAAVVMARRWRPVLRGSVEAHWILPAAVMFLGASAGRIQIGERYILPVYPYLILLAASCLPAALASRSLRALAVAALALHAGPSLLAAPQGYLSYFNLLAGGSDGGHRVLLDSNLDWGQDLPRLAAWMGHKGISRIQLGYHGSDDPGRYGIEHEDLPGLHMYAPHPPAHPFAGTVAVSPNLLLGVFDRPGQTPYAELRARAPDDRAGVFFIYGSGPR